MLKRVGTGKLTFQEPLDQVVNVKFAVLRHRDGHVNQRPNTRVDWAARLHPVSR